jgi:hypothetical protein
MRIRVLRAFYFGGTRQEPGAAMEVPDQQGRELIAVGKAEATGALPVVKGPMTTESVSTLVQGKVRKGVKDVSQ